MRPPLFILLFLCLFAGQICAQQQGATDPVSSIQADGWYYIKYGDYYLSYDADRHIVLRRSPDLGSSWCAIDPQTGANQWKFKNYKSMTELGIQQRDINYIAKPFGDRTLPYTITYDSQTGSFSFKSSAVYWGADDGNSFYMTGESVEASDVANHQNHVIGSESEVFGWKLYGPLTKETLDDISGKALLWNNARNLYLAYGNSVNHIQFDSGKFTALQNALQNITQDIENAGESDVRENLQDNTKYTALKDAYDAITSWEIVQPIPGSYYRLKSVYNGKYANSRVDNNRFLMADNTDGDYGLSTLVQYTQDKKLVFLESGKAIANPISGPQAPGSAAISSFSKSGYLYDTKASYYIQTEVYLYAGDAILDQYSSFIDNQHLEWYLEEVTTDNLSYSRDVNAGYHWATFCLPYAIKATVQDDYELFDLKSVSNNTLVLGRIYNVAAGQPVLGYLKNGSTFTIPAASAALASTPQTGSSQGGLTLTGNYAQTSITSGYYIAQDAFWQATKTISVKPYRAVFSGNASYAQQLRISTFFEEETGIEPIYDNGNDNIYDLTGLPHQELQNGLNIIHRRNGTIRCIVIR